MELSPGNADPCTSLHVKECVPCLSPLRAESREPHEVNDLYWGPCLLHYKRKSHWYLL